MKKLHQNNSGRIKWFELALTALGSCVILFIVAPLISMVLATSFGDLTETAADSQVIQSIKLTLTAAFFATAVSALVGIPLAYLLARKKFFGRSVLLAIIDLPIIIPHSAAGIALLTVIVFATIFGTLVPLLLDKRNIDAALATGPFITTVNDVLGLFLYFMIGRMMYV